MGVVVVLDAGEVVAVLAELEVLAPGVHPALSHDPWPVGHRDDQQPPEQHDGDPVEEHPAGQGLPT